MKTFFVVNPRAATVRPEGAGGALGAHRSALANSPCFTQGPMTPPATRRKALARATSGVAVGGDGTVNEVVMAFPHGKPVRPGAVLGCFPRHRGDFKRTFGWDNDSTPRSPGSVGPDRALTWDCSSSHARREGGPPLLRNCSFGVKRRRRFRKVNRSSKMLGGKLSFMLGTCARCSSTRTGGCTSPLDGGPNRPSSDHDGRRQRPLLRRRDVRRPRSQHSDGQFDVTVWTGYGLVDFALKSKRSTTGLT